MLELLLIIILFAIVIVIAIIYRNSLKRIFIKKKKELKETVYEKKHDAGVGMFYDRMSQQFLTIIRQQNLSDYKFIPIQRLKYYVLSNIKNINDEDIFPILNVMKDTQLLSDVLEINPNLQIIIFNRKDGFSLSKQEKEVLTHIFNESGLTEQQLKKLTKWRKSRINKVLNNLIKKGIVKVLGENIIVESFGLMNERQNWHETIQKKIQEEKEKEEQKQQREEERANLFKQKKV